MSSLAHEGNPKEDTIIITGGDVLSTASLSIPFLFFGGGQPPNIPPAEPPSNISSSCPDVLGWPDGRNFIPLYYNDPQSGGSLTIWTDQGGLLGGVAPVNTWLSLFLESSQGCCGCAFVPV